MRLHYVDRGGRQIVFRGDSPDFVYKLPMAVRFLRATDEQFVSRGGEPLRTARGRIMRLRRIMALLSNRGVFVRCALTLDRLSKSVDGELERFFPHTEIRELGGVDLVIGRHEFSYSGPALWQAWVDDFFDRQTPLDSFDWDELVEIVTGLWRQGVGMASIADTWGQKNWGRDRHGRVRLVDTSHLTNDLAKVEARIVPGATRALQAKLIGCGAGTPECVRAYFAHLERRINPETLHSIWRADVTPAPG